MNLVGGANFVFYLTAGKLADPGGITAESYSADTWYRIEARNIDWDNYTFDRYVNSTSPWGLQFKTLKSFITNQI